MEMKRHDAPQTHRTRSIVALTEAVKIPMAPGRIAFLGAATDAESSVLVQCMCWPMMPDAWTALTQTWRNISVTRAEPANYITTPRTSPSTWVSTCAPQLAAPYRNTTAEESSIAALLMRTPMQVAITIRDTANARSAATGAVQGQALSDCLVIYDHFASLPGRNACTLLVSGRLSSESEQRYQKGFVRCCERMPHALWLRDMHLRFWKEPIEPLPLELAHIVAASVVRHHLHAQATNPIFAAVQAKLARSPSQRKHPEK